MTEACCSSRNFEWGPNALVREIDKLDIFACIYVWLSSACFLEEELEVAEGECETGHPWLSPVLGWLRSCVDHLEIVVGQVLIFFKIPLA